MSNRSDINLRPATQADGSSILGRAILYKREKVTHHKPGWESVLCDVSQRGWPILC